MEVHEAQTNSGPSNASSKSPIVRGARACRTCRAAKMKCVGGEENVKPCQRCQRSGVDCVFDKHRRGRKPGSKLSEASKLLRRLEKGLHAAKSISQANELNASTPYIAPESRSSHPSYRLPSLSESSSMFSSNMLPPIQGSYSHSCGSASVYNMDLDAEDSDEEVSDTESKRHRVDYDYPAKLIKQERNKNPHLHNLLNPVDEAPVISPVAERSTTAYSGSGHGQPLQAYALTQQPLRGFNNNLHATTQTQDALHTSHQFPSARHLDQPQSSHQQPLPASPSAALRPAPLPEGLDDPISAGLIDENRAINLLEMIFLRLNPFINLFDPALHTVAYLRHRSPFLFTVLMTIGMKFWDDCGYAAAQKLTQKWTVAAFAEGWSSVEVCQAFCCLTYWKEPEDTHTWMYIGYAARMAVELGLNKFVARSPPTETDLAMRQRRSAERTYLVIFVHDRSLSMQTGRQWMLPECELVRHADKWHLRGPGSSFGSAMGSVMLSSGPGSVPPPPPVQGSVTADSLSTSSAEPQPQDVILAAMVQLRRLATETIDKLNTAQKEVNYEAELSMGNTKLQQWQEHWHNEMSQVNGTKFHFSFLNLFRLNVKLFLNSYGLQAAFASNHQSQASQQLLLCYDCAMDMLRTISKDIADAFSLRYAQESVNTMSAYAAVFLLKLLRSGSIVAQLPPGSTEQVLCMINTTANVYNESSTQPHSPTTVHARFLVSLVRSHRPPQAQQASVGRYFDERPRARVEIPSVSGGVSLPSSSQKNYPAPPTPMSTSERGIQPPPFNDGAHHQLQRPPYGPGQQSGQFGYSASHSAHLQLSAERSSHSAHGGLSTEFGSSASSDIYRSNGNTYPTPPNGHLHQPQYQHQSQTSFSQLDSTSEDARYRQHMLRDIGFSYGGEYETMFDDIGTFVPGGAGPALPPTALSTYGNGGYGTSGSMPTGGGLGGQIYHSMS